MILKEGQEGDTVKYVGSVARAITAGDSHLADDLTQDVLLVALANSPRDEDSLLPWLRSITQNKLKYARFRSATRPRHSTNADENLERMRARELDPVQSLTQAELKERVQKLLLALPEGHQEIVRMRAIEDLPPREVAKRLGIPVETVRTTYRRSLVVLREGADREVGDDALGEWRLPAAFLWGMPKRAAWSALGLASVLIVCAVGLWKLQGAEDLPEALVPIEMQADLAAVTAPVDLGTLPVETRALTAPLLAQVDLRVAHEGQPVHGEEVTLSSASGNVMLGRTDVDGALQLAELAPGPWTAWHRGKLIDSKELESGANAWDLQVELDLGMQVKVVNRDGQPVQGVYVYRLDESTNRSAPLGQTDAAGQLEARVPLSGSWVAARGPAGFSSSAAYLDQPMVDGRRGALELILEDHSVAWYRVKFPDGVPSDSRNVVTKHRRPTATTQQSISRGIERNSYWLPPWRRADGAYGVRRGPGIAFVALDAAGEPWWVSRENRQIDPLEQTLEAKLPFTVTGLLVDPEGLPLPGMDVFVAGGAADGMSTLRTTTDEGGRFSLAGCPEDRVRLRCEVGKQAVAKRPIDGDVVDIGEWQIRHATVELEAIGSPGPWKCTTFKPALLATLPEFNPSLVGMTREVFASSALEHCKIDIPRGDVGEAILVEAGEGEGTRSLFVKRPKGGWKKEAVRVELGLAHPVRLYAQYPRDRFPVRAVWVEDDLRWASTALADPASGLISSALLPAGRWSLKLVDCLSLSSNTEVRSVGAGNEYDFGALSLNSGRARVNLSMGGLSSQHAGGILRAIGEDGIDAAKVFIKAGEPIPYEIVTELAVGKYRFLLKMIGGDGAVGEGMIERGFITDVTLSRSHLYVALGAANLGRKQVTGASLILLDSAGIEVWREPVPAQIGGAARTHWFIVPRLAESQLCAELSDGTLVPTLLAGVNVSTIIFLPFKTWTGSTE